MQRSTISCWQVRDRAIDLALRPLIMGIVNATPDSFSDGGQFLPTEAAVAHALELIEQGADLLDIGGESTRPGSLPVPVEEELRRVVPVVEALAASDRLGSVLLSVDTSKAEVAERCLEAGAHVINDVTALRGNPHMGEVVKAHRAGIILMHMQGTPATMQQNPHYDDVITEVMCFFQERLQVCADLGIAAACVVLDPGIGFGKTAAHNAELLARLDEFLTLGRPICLGVSRKGFLGRLLARDIGERLAGSLAVVCDALQQQSAQLFRVHDVGPTRDVLRVLTTLADLREKRP
jgi:dihydropteroate synthase